MLLSRLQARNFRQYRELDLAFKDGITGIVGRNGSGKSTVLEAIVWCLFGNRAARTSKEGIKRQAAAESETCSVSLDFLLGDTAYRLTRSLVGRTVRSEAELIQDERIDAVTTREVDDYVVRLIGLNLKGFLSSFFARQRELNALSDARPADRKDQLAKMLGVGRLDSAFALLKEEIKQIRQRIDILSGLQIDPKAVAKEADDRRAEISELEGRRKSALDSLGKAKTEIEEKAKEIEQLKEMELRHNNLRTRLSQREIQAQPVSREISRSEQELAELEKLAPRLTILRESTVDLDGFEKKVGSMKEARLLVEEQTRLKRDLANVTAGRKRETERTLLFEKEIQKLTQALAGTDTLDRKIAEAEARLESLREDYRRLDKEIGILKDKLATLDDQKAEISELGPEASCKLCLRPFAGELDDIERHFDEERHSIEQRMAPMQARLGGIFNKAQSLKERLESDKKRRNQANRDEQSLASARSAREGAEKALDELNKRICEIEARLKEIGEVCFDPSSAAAAEAELAEKRKARDELIRLQERIARRPEIEKQIAESRRESAVIEKELVELRDQIKKLGFDSEHYTHAQGELQKARDGAADIRLEIERISGQIQLKSARADELSNQLREYKRSQKEISALREDLRHLEKLSILFADFRVYLIGRIRPALSKQTSQLFYEMTAGRYQDVELDEDYSLQIYDRGERFPISRFSGGEIDLANLCFRLAISVEMASTAGIEQNFIILDEIFGSQDTERQRMIFDGLGRLKKRFRQIIIISHIDDVKEMAENIVSVEVDETGISRAQAVER